jgi:hypothetical protein
MHVFDVSSQTDARIPAHHDVELTTENVAKMGGGGIAALRRLRLPWGGQIQRPEHFRTTVMMSRTGLAQRSLQSGRERSVAVQPLDLDFAKDENFRRLSKDGNLVQHYFDAL